MHRGPLMAILRLEGTFIPWSRDLRKHLLDKFPLCPGQLPIPESVQLPPKWVLAFEEFDPNGKGLSPEPATPQAVLGEQYTENARQRKAQCDVDYDVRPIPNTVSATMMENTRITPLGHWQDVRHIILTVQELVPYVPGDVVCITPRNFAADVDSLISLMGWEDEADKPLCFVSGTKFPLATHLPPPQIPFLLTRPGFTLRTLLTDYLDIMAIPRRSFFANIAQFTNDAMHKERLLEFANPEYIDEFYDYTTRPRRSILEVLHEFDGVKIPWQQVCAVFPVLRGRQFSIASGGKLKRAADGGTRFDLLVAIVKYQTIIKKIREGVCTRYLSFLQPGSILKIQVQRGGLNSAMEQLTRPIVLIGPGTGLAPLRSVLWEKAAMVEAFRRQNGPGDTAPVGPIVLLFGGRNRNADFFFESEWEELKKILNLKVLTAFSRDQRHKIYVQDRIRENHALFFNMLNDQEGTVYICGSSGIMPKAVREALIESFQNPGVESGNSREEAEKYLIDMEKTGRYKQETW
jgi:sulfite reductase alpha subunit-like flavoprotein